MKAHKGSRASISYLYLESLHQSLKCKSIGRHVLYPQPELNPIYHTKQRYWFEKIGEVDMRMRIWERNGHTFTAVSHEIPHQLFTSTLSITRNKQIKRLCRMTKKQIELSNLSRALDG